MENKKYIIIIKNCIEKFYIHLHIQEDDSVDILIWIMFAVEATMGFGSIIMIVAVMFGTIIKKIYRKVKYKEAIM